MMLHIKLLMVQTLYLLFSIKEAGILEYVIELNLELLIEYISYFVKKNNVSYVYFHNSTKIDINLDDNLPLKKQQLGML